MFSCRSAVTRTVPIAFLTASLALPLAIRAQTGTPTPRFDPKAEALLQRAADRMKAARSFSGQVNYSAHRPVSQQPAEDSHALNTFHLQRPNFLYNQIRIVGTVGTGAGGKKAVTPTTKYISDGKKGMQFSLVDKTYRPLPVTVGALASSYSLNYPEFFAPAISDAQMARAAKASGWLVSLTMLPDVVFSGVPCFVIEEKNLLSKDTKSVSAFRTTRIYIGKKDGVIHGSHIEAPGQGAAGEMETSDTVVTNVVVDGNIPASTFALDLTGYKPYAASRRPSLLAAGIMAPDFTVYDKTGKALKLSDFRGKIVVLDFWATWCGPCMQSFPHTTSVAKKTADKGVVVLAVNVWDTKAPFTKWLPKHPEYAPLTFAIDTTPGKGKDIATKLYKVSGIPTQYVIDRKGKIVTSFVGFSGPTGALEKAIEKADAGGVAMAQK